MPGIEQVERDIEARERVLASAEKQLESGLELVEAVMEPASVVEWVDNYLLARYGRDVIGDATGR